jgi:hypothetical protein
MIIKIKKSMNGRKIILGFKFTLHKIKAPRDHGHVNGEKNQH